MPQTELGLPDPAVVPIGEGRHVFQAGVMARLRRVAHFAPAGLAAGREWGEIPRGDPVGEKGKRALVERRIVEPVVEGERNPIMAAELVV